MNATGDLTETEHDQDVAAHADFAPLRFADAASDYELLTPESAAELGL